MAAILILAAIPALFLFLYYFGPNILDAFSPIKREYGVIAEKEYTPSQAKIVTERMTRGYTEQWGATSYDILTERQLPEEHQLHLRLNEKIIITPVKSKLYDSLHQGDHVLIHYSQGRFSQKINVRKITRL